MASEADLLRVAAQLGIATPDLRKSLNYAGLDLCTSAERDELVQLRERVKELEADLEREAALNWERINAAVEARAKTPAEQAVLDAMDAIPDGTLKVLLQPSVLNFSSTLLEALKAELTRRAEKEKKHE